MSKYTKSKLNRVLENDGEFLVKIKKETIDKAKGKGKGVCMHCRYPIQMSAGQLVYFHSESTSPLGVDCRKLFRESKGSIVSLKSDGKS